MVPTGVYRALDSFLTYSCFTKQSVLKGITLDVQWVKNNMARGQTKIDKK